MVQRCVEYCTCGKQSRSATSSVEAMTSRTRTHEDEDDDEAEALDDEEVRPGSVLDVLAEKDEDAADVVLSFRRRFGLYVFPATMQASQQRSLSWVQDTCTHSCISAEGLPEAGCTRRLAWSLLS